MVRPNGGQHQINVTDVDCSTS